MLEFEPELAAVIESPLGRWAGEAIAGAARVAPKASINLLDVSGGTAATLDSGTAELSHIAFPHLNQQSADFTFQVNSGSELRSVNVHLPPNFDPAKATPAYFLMDGAQYGDPEGEMLQGYHWADTADRNGFAAISLVQSEASHMPLPEKLARMFPEHSTWRSPYGLIGPSQTVDDLGYFNSVLGGVMRAMKVDKLNVVGFCDGGCLAHGLATRLPLNGIATVGSTVFKDSKLMPMAGARGFFTTIKDDLIIPEAGGPGRTFGKFLAQNGQTKILNSAPLEQGALYARANDLVPGGTMEMLGGTARTWVAPGTQKAGVIELSLNEGGHNWPGTRFSSLSMTKAEQISPDAARTLNQKIVDFFEAPRNRFS
jgi:poly(3-hydroxybutyrate) depolymerase